MYLNRGHSKCSFRLFLLRVCFRVDCYLRALPGVTLMYLDEHSKHSGGIVNASGFSSGQTGV